MKTSYDVIIENMGNLKIDSKDYKASGGEADVYVVGGMALKIYHDVAKMIPIDKIKELSKLTPPSVTKPEHVVFDRKTNKAIGYAMKALPDLHPLPKLFIRGFKKQNNISYNTINTLVKNFQLSLTQIHAEKFLVVDLNEMNELATKDFKDIVYIDVDSWQTVNYPATAIMDSIRDRLVKHNQFTEQSDWFSWGILAFQLYINIHPYQGGHPDYQPREWVKRMDDNISVFAKGARMPIACNSLDVIPPRHLEWFRAVFDRKERSAPPLPDSITPIKVPQQAVVMLASTAHFEVTQEHNFPASILSVLNLFGTYYVVTPKAIYTTRTDAPIMTGLEFFPKTLLCETDQQLPIVAQQTPYSQVLFRQHNGVQIGTIAAMNMFYRNGCIYTYSGTKLVQNRFTNFGSALIHRAEHIENVSELTTKMFDGCVYQNLLGNSHLTIPYEQNKCFTKATPELDGYRILDAKSEKHIVVVIGEKKGRYSRFIFIWDFAAKTYSIRVVEGIAYSDINFTVLPNGVCVLLSADDKVEVFRDNQTIKEISDPPFDSSMSLFNVMSKVCFVDGGTIFGVKLK
jgi:hypothetical protein